MNILYCPEDASYQRTLFGTITDFADVRTAVNNSMTPTNGAVTALSLLEHFDSSHISVLDSLDILTRENPKLNSLVKNKGFFADNNHSFYCSVLFSFFLPQCSVYKLFSI